MTFEMKKPDDPNSEEKDKLIINSVDHNKKNQKMRIIEQENGFCEIVCEQKSLHAPGNEKNSGLQLKFKNQNENNQRFAIVPSMDYPNAYLIKTSYEKFFEVLSGKT